MNLIINASEAVGERSGVITISTGIRECDQDYLQGAISGKRSARGCVRVPGGI